MKIKIIAILCFLALIIPAHAEHIRNDGMGGFYTDNGHVRSDGFGGYYTNDDHVRSDGLGGYYTKNGHIRSDGMGGFYTDNDHIVQIFAKYFLYFRSLNTNN